MKPFYKGLRNKLSYYRPLFNILTLLKSIAFNLYYLPFRTAIKLPIWVYKPKFIKLRGKVIIPLGNSQIKSGMVRLGFRGNRCFPSNGFIWSNEGTIVFEGNCQIGNNSAIVTGGGGGGGNCIWQIFFSAFFCEAHIILRNLFWREMCLGLGYHHSRHRLSSLVRYENEKIQESIRQNKNWRLQLVESGMSRASLSVNQQS